MTTSPSAAEKNGDSERSHQFSELQQRLLTHLTSVVRERDLYVARGGHILVREYIREQLKQWGTVETHEFQWQNKIYQNLTLKLSSADAASKSSRPASPPILVGAHYDGVVGSPGADDNGTGVAVLLELAQQFAQRPLSTYDLWFVAFDLEESGLVGSRAYADELHRQEQTLRLMLSLEMLGYCDRTPGSQSYPVPILKWFYPNQGDFITLVGTVMMVSELRSLASSMRQVGMPTEWLPAGFRGNIVPDTRRSDHAPFWDRGYKALMVTDTSFLRNPHYHKASDRIETLDLDFLSRVCWSLEHAIRQM